MLEDTIAFAQALERRGCDALNVSTGGLHITQDIPLAPSYQVPFARRIKDAVTMPVVAVGLITEPAQAEAIIATGDADLIGRLEPSCLIQDGHGMQPQYSVQRSRQPRNICAVSPRP